MTQMNANDTTCSLYRTHQHGLANVYNITTYPTRQSHTVHGVCDKSFMETGYIAVTPDKVTDGQYISGGHPASKNFFYYFAESRHSANDPLILWLAGGPGVSAMVNMFYENGPCYITPELNAVRNKYSWTEHANMLWIDSPAGVGFSYLNNMTDRAHTSEQVAVDVAKFLQVVHYSRSDNSRGNRASRDS